MYMHLEYYLFNIPLGIRANIFFTEIVHVHLSYANNNLF